MLDHRRQSAARLRVRIVHLIVRQRDFLPLPFRAPVSVVRLFLLLGRPACSRSGPPGGSLGATAATSSRTARRRRRRPAGDGLRARIRPGPLAWGHERPPAVGRLPLRVAGTVVPAEVKQIAAEVAGLEVGRRGGGGGTAAAGSGPVRGGFAAA